MWASLSVCPRGYHRNHTRDLYQFLCLFPVSVARSSDTFMIGRIAYRREGVFFPLENALSAGKGGWECTAWAKYAIYDCFAVKATALKQQISKFYLQILSTEASFYIYDRPLTDINAITSTCALNLRIKF